MSKMHRIWRILKVKFQNRIELPSFYILGAAKAGTTSLYNYIHEYSCNFAPPENKELYFFTENYYKGVLYYKSFFQKVKKGYITCDATPDYLFYPLSPERICSVTPKAKFVVILRDPVERAISHYWFMNSTIRTKAYDPLPIKDAFIKEKERIRLSKVRSIRYGSFEYAYKYFSYKERGLYYEQLRNWINFFPINRFFIIEYNSFFRGKEFKTIFLDLLDFLGLEYNGKEIIRDVHNKNENKGETPEEVIEYLADYFKKPNKQLFGFLGEHYDWIGT